VFWGEYFLVIPSARYSADFLLFPIVLQNKDQIVSHAFLEQLCAFLHGLRVSGKALVPHMYACAHPMPKGNWAQHDLRTLHSDPIDLPTGGTIGDVLKLNRPARTSMALQAVTVMLRPSLDWRVEKSFA
jgi:hypothetical protein